MAVQVFRKPVLINRQAPGVAEVHQREHPYRRVREDRAPRNSPALARTGWVVRTDQLPFRVVHGSMLVRGVAIVEIPDRSPPDAENSEGEERCAPTAHCNQRHHQWWRECLPDPRPGVRDPLRVTSFGT